MDSFVVALGNIYAPNPRRGVTTPTRRGCRWNYDWELCVAERCVRSRLNLFKATRRSSSLRIETDTKWECNARWLLDQSLLPGASYIIQNDNNMFKPSYITRLHIHTFMQIIRQNSVVQEFLKFLYKKIGNWINYYYNFFF